MEMNVPPMARRLHPPADARRAPREAARRRLGDLDARPRREPPPDPQDGRADRVLHLRARRAALRGGAAALVRLARGGTVVPAENDSKITA
jgi:hypothetical protein